MSHIHKWGISYHSQLFRTMAFIVITKGWWGYILGHSLLIMEYITSFNLRLMSDTQVIQWYQAKSRGPNTVGFSILIVASFPGLQSPNTVEDLVKLLRRMTSGRH